MALVNVYVSGGVVDVRSSSAVQIIPLQPGQKPEPQIALSRGTEVEVRTAKGIEKIKPVSVKPILHQIQAQATDKKIAK